MIKMTHTAAALATALCLISGAALGATPDIAKSPALTKIQNNNVLVVGHRTSSIPFSYYDANQKPIGRSEEHTSELQSLMRISYAVFCLKKKNKSHKMQNTT